MAKTLRNKIADVNKHKFVEATLIDAVGSLCSVKIGGKRGNGGVLRGIPFVGPAGDFGQKVYVDYSSGKPIVYIYGKPEEEAQTPRPIVQRPTNSEPPSETGSTGGEPSTDHTHNAILLSGATDATWFDNTVDGFLGAIAAAQDTDTITIPSFYGDVGVFTLPLGVNLYSSGESSIFCTMTLGGANIIEGIKFYRVPGGATPALIAPSSILPSVVRNCSFTSGETTATAYPIQLGHGGTTTIEFWNCTFTSVAISGDSYVFYSTIAHGSPPAASTKVFYCYLSAQSNSGTADLWNSNCKIGTYGCSWLDGLDPGANVFWIDGDRTASSANDPTAIHTDGSGEIAALTEKATPIDADLLVIEDSEAANVKKKVQIGSLVPAVDTTDFDNNLSAADDTVQKALDTLDDLDISSGAFSDVSWTFGGYIAAQADAGATIVAPRACAISKVIVYAKTPGTAGSTVVDVNKNGVSIFSSNPTLAYNDADKLVSAIPSVTNVVANDVFTVDIDVAATGAADLTVQLHFSVNMGAEVDANAVHVNAASEIYGIIEKTTPHNNDLLIVEDSEDGYAKKKMKITTLPFTSSTIGKEKLFTREGDLEASSGTIRIANHCGNNRIITGVYLDINTAPTGATVIVDIHKGGTTIFTNQAHRPVVAIGAFAGNTTTIDINAWNDGEYLTCDVDQVGSTIAGADLTVTIKYLE